MVFQELTFARSWGNCKPEDQWSCKRSPDTWYIFYAFVLLYSPRVGADNPLGTNVDVNRKPLSLCPFVASFKTISLKYGFKVNLNGFIHVYNPGERAEKPLGTNFWCQQKALITSNICCKFQTNLFELWFYTPFSIFFHMYIALGEGHTTLCGQKHDVNRKALSLFPICCKFQKNIFEVWFYT